MKSVDALYAKVSLGVDDQGLARLIAEGVLRPAYWAVGGTEPFFDLGHVLEVGRSRADALGEKLKRMAGEP